MNTDSGIEGPKDLSARRVGVPEYQITVAIWAEVFYSMSTGSRLKNKMVYRRAKNSRAAKTRSSPTWAKTLTSDGLARTRHYRRCLEHGEIDALIWAHIPSPFVRRSPKVKRLIRKLP